MGIGFVLLVWFILGCISAIPVSIFLVIVYYRKKRKTPIDGKRIIKSIGLAALPFLFLIYFVIAFVIYGFWCDFYRGVDPGLGDCWYVPLGAGYEISMIDVPDKAWIDKNDEPVLSGIVEIQKIYPYIYGRRESRYFMLDMNKGNLIYHNNIDALNEALRAKGIMQVKKLQSVHSFYISYRWGYRDLIAVVIIMIPPAIGGFLILKFLILPRRKINAVISS
jgi:hypothetical protein